jgi:hypothetical protein
MGIDDLYKAFWADIIAARDNPHFDATILNAAKKELENAEKIRASKMKHLMNTYPDVILHKRETWLAGIDIVSDYEDEAERIITHYLKSSSQKGVDHV